MNRIYLKDIVQITARRGQYYLLFKTSHSEWEPNNCLYFLQFKATKPNGMKLPEPLHKPRGFPSEKKEHILKVLNTIMPENRKDFWRNIPARTDSSVGYTCTFRKRLVFCEVLWVVKDIMAEELAKSLGAIASILENLQRKVDDNGTQSSAAVNPKNSYFVGLAQF
ncbi:unnamed protein product [Acanthoscelides obtectus]|uniref:Uncharacterized protein n=1 Tax=Acanthoscelides obtectus TaxID=200917 RepID=A0A9P0VP69_ACAOB|nr:unnamed protein product [Acanthoscelides obtectus]CAK1630944.1 hypothetical protein AOBTE_LOCUS6663 [Acanthoscelides obtectus]